MTVQGKQAGLGLVVQGTQAGLGLTRARLRSPASTEALDDRVKPIGIPGEAAWPSGKADEYYFVTARAAAAPAVSLASLLCCMVPAHALGKLSSWGAHSLACANPAQVCWVLSGSAVMQSVERALGGSKAVGSLSPKSRP